MADLKSNKKQTASSQNESAEQALARTITSPECLSASVLTICQNVDHARVVDLVDELKSNQPQ